MLQFLQLTLKNGSKLSNHVFYASIHKYAKIEFKTSFAYKILKHFRSNPQYITHEISEEKKFNSSKTEIKSILRNEKKISLMNTNDLLSCMLIICSDISDIKVVVKNVDKEICKRLCEKDIINNYTEVLKITDTLIYFTHNRINLINSYYMCVENIRNIIIYNEITPPHLIQCVFYISVLKKDPLAVSTLKLILGKIHKQLKIFEVMTPTQLAIFCNSVYKSSTKILSKRTLETIIGVVDKQTDYIFSSEAICVSILKSLHQTKYHDYQFLEKLSVKIIHERNINLGNYTFRSTVYVIKLFSNALYNDENFINYLADDAIEKLLNLHQNKEYIRAKDISILLKSFSELGFDSLRHKTVKNILPVLREAYDNDQINTYELKSFADIILWLVVLGINDVTFLDKVVNLKLLIRGKDNSSSKGLSRMNLLLTILSIEKLLQPDRMDDLVSLMEPTEGHSLEQLFKSQPTLYHVYQTVKFLAATKSNVIQQATIDFQIPNLFIPGITVETKSCKISIEILDKKSCLHNTLIPHGYMKLKLRLLRKAGYEILMITEDMVSKGSEHVLITIEDNIRRIEEIALSI